MSKEKNRLSSFRSVLSFAILICWILPIVIISITASVLLNRSYNRTLQQGTEADMRGAMRQVELRLNAVIDDAKSVSYDDVVRQTWREGKADRSHAVTEYLTQKFSRNLTYRAIFISYRERNAMSYICAPGVDSAALVREFQEHVLPAARVVVGRTDSGTQFMERNGSLYLVYNLPDKNSVPFATLVIALEKAELMQSLYGFSQNQILTVTLDGIPISLGIVPNDTMDPSRTADMTYESEVDGHRLVCTGQVIGLNIWATLPMLWWIVLFVGSLVIPMLAVTVWLFHRNINHPIEVLIQANTNVQNQRGYQIPDKAPNTEFSTLYNQFNSMSSELSSQFDRLYEEQQALQQAKIKALQSQINPHFLNNTLEIINWEARIADDQRVCSMIEALSTMLDAAIGRDGRSQVLLSEELKYAEAYLYITKERLGDRLTVRKDIAPDTLGLHVPLLILQPILENAVEYDLSRTGGALSLRIYRQDTALHIEVEHDGHITEEGWKKIRTGLRPDADSVTRMNGRSVGVHNVVNRLSLLYGPRATFDIREDSPGTILAEIVLDIL